MIWSALTLGCVHALPAAGADASAARPAITGLAYVRFYESDLPAAKHFYGSLLGLHETDQPGGDASFAVGMRQRIEIAPLPQGETGRLARVGFLTRDLPGMKQYLEAHGQKVQAAGADEIEVIDPEGNHIRFVRESRAAAETAGPGGAARGTTMVAAGQPGAPTSRRMIHAGFKVDSREAEDRFYIQLLGFKPYWHGGMQPDKTDWVSLQVPDGTDWIEYMLGQGAHPGQRQLGVLDHTSLGVEHIDSVTKQLIANGMSDPNQRKSQIGKDGKWQLNVFDPDLSRVEFMEFKPTQAPCCSEFTGKQPSPGDAE